MRYSKNCYGFPPSQELILDGDNISGEFWDDLIYKKEKCESCRIRREKFLGSEFCAAQIMMYVVHQFFLMHFKFPSDNQLKSFFLKMKRRKQDRDQKDSI